MALPAAAVIAPIAISAATSVMGALMNDRGRKDAASERDSARKLILEQMPPDPKDQALYLEMLRSEGVLTPELEQEVTLANPAMEGVKADPRLREAQQTALAQLQEMAKGGYTVEDRAAISQMQSENAARERGQREAVLQNLAARGMGGSGVELASQLEAQQSAANRNSQQGLDIAAQGRQRALQALMQSSAVAGDMRNQDVGEQERVAQARDRIAEFNARNRQQVQGSNVGALNAAQAANLASAQSIANANTGLRNTAQTSNKQLGQQYFDNSMRQATVAGNMAVNAASGTEGRAAANAANVGQLGSTVMAGMNSYQDRQAADEDRRLKQRELDMMAAGLMNSRGNS